MMEGKLALHEMTNILALIQEADKLTPEMEEQLDMVAGALPVKVGTILEWVGRMEAEAAYYDSEAKRIAAKAAARKKKTDRLKEYVKACMVSANIDNVEAGTRTVKLQANPPAVNITDEALIPPRFFVVVPQSLKLDKALIKEAIKVGEEVPGVELTREISLRIR